MRLHHRKNALGIESDKANTNETLRNWFENIIEFFFHGISNSIHGVIQFRSECLVLLTSTFKKKYFVKMKMPIIHRRKKNVKECDRRYVIWARIGRKAVKTHRIRFYWNNTQNWSEHMMIKNVQTMQVKLYMSNITLENQNTIHSAEQIALSPNSIDSVSELIYVNKMSDSRVQQEKKESEKYLRLKKRTECFIWNVVVCSSNENIDCDFLLCLVFQSFSCHPTPFSRKLSTSHFSDHASWNHVSLFKRFHFSIFIPMLLLLFFSHLFVFVQFFNNLLESFVIALQNGYRFVSHDRHKVCSNCCHLWQIGVISVSFAVLFIAMKFAKTSIVTDIVGSHESLCRRLNL